MRPVFGQASRRALLAKQISADPIPITSDQDGQIRGHSPANAPKVPRALSVSNNPSFEELPSAQDYEPRSPQVAPLRLLDRAQRPSKTYSASSRAPTRRALASPISASALLSNASNLRQKPDRSTVASERSMLITPMQPFGVALSESRASHLASPTAALAGSS